MEYNSSVEHESETKKQVSVTIPAGAWGSEVESALTRLGQRASIKGFRPGKAPRSMIEKMFGEQARIETINRLVGESLREILRENSFSPLGDPNIEIESLEPGKDLSYKARFSIFPKPEVSDYDTFAVTIKKREPSNDDVEEVIKSVLRSKASLAPVTDREAAAEGDVVEGELMGRVAGQEASGRPEPFYVRLGDHRVPVDVENGITGMKIGETKEIETIISQDHPDENVRGKQAFYTVTVKGISQEILPEISDDFVKSLDGPEQTVLELRMAIRQRLEKDAEEMGREQVKSKIIEHLVAGNEFELPQELVDDELRNLLAQRGLVKAQEAGTLDLTPFRERFEAEAVRRVKAAILIDRIAEKESLHAKSEDIDQHMKDTAAAYGVSLDEVRKFYSKEEGRLVGVFIEMTRRNVLNFLSERATVTEEAA